MLFMFLRTIPSGSTPFPSCASMTSTWSFAHASVTFLTPCEKNGNWHNAFATIVCRKRLAYHDEVPACPGQFARKLLNLDSLRRLVLLLWKAAQSEQGEVVLESVGTVVMADACQQFL